MIERASYIRQVELALGRSPVVALLGPRQCGKTTLARRVAAARRSSDYFDLGSPRDQRRLQNPEMAMENSRGLVVLDEIQDMPELFAVLRSVVDRKTDTGRFLVLGSASPALVKGASESLAGRIEFVDLTAFLLMETGYENQRRLWIRGGFPRSYLARSLHDSLAWREGFIRTFLQRDLPQLGITIPAPAMRRFWTMLAHYHGQTWNASDISRSLGVSDKTVRSYLDILTQTYMIRQLQPWYENIGKRQVKAPKIYFRDSGLMHSLLSLDDENALMAHPRVGASWEGFALEQVLGLIRPSAAYYWAAYSGGEIDLLFETGGNRYGVEFKFSEAPTVEGAASRIADALGLKHLWIVCPCKHAYPVSERITVTSIEEFTPPAR
jgi:uncharacterized protein